MTGPAACGTERATFWRRSFGSGAVVGGGLVIEMGALFVRTIILARLLGADQFGIAAAMNTLAALVEMVSFLGIDRYLVYAVDGGDAEALGVANMLSVLRGVLSAGIALLLAWPTAALIHAAPLWPAFLAVALCPLLRGAAHLGVYQQQRQLRFAPAACADAGAALLGLVVAVGAGLIAPDYRALLWGLLAQAAGNLALSHLFSRGVPYRLSLARAHLRAALRFGMPLMGNGLILAATTQLDRMIVGAWMGPAMLGLYGLSFTLVIQPMNLMGRLANTAWQPPLSAAWHAGRAGAFTGLASRLGQYIVLAGGCGAAATLCLGAPLLRMIFGSSYTTNDAFFALLAGIVLTRMTRTAMNLFGLAIGATADLAIMNGAGVVGLPLMVLLVWLHPTLASAVTGGLAGELMALVVAHARLRRRYGNADRTALVSFLIAATMLGGLAVWVLVERPGLTGRLAGAGLMIAVLVSKTFFSEEKKQKTFVGAVAEPVMRACAGSDCLPTRPAPRRARGQT